MPAPSCTRRKIGSATVRYFKQRGEELDMPYQTLINLYLRDCAATGRTLSMKWRPKGNRVA